MTVMMREHTTKSFPSIESRREQTKDSFPSLVPSKENISRSFYNLESNKCHTTRSFPSLSTHKEAACPQSQRMIDIMTVDNPIRLYDECNRHEGQNQFYLPRVTKEQPDLMGSSCQQEHYNNKIIFSNQPTTLHTVQRRYSMMMEQRNSDAQRFKSNLISRSTGCIEPAKDDKTFAEIKRRYSESHPPNHNRHTQTTSFSAKVNRPKTISYRLEKLKGFGYKYDPATPTNSKTDVHDSNGGTEISNTSRLTDKNGNEIGKIVKYTSRRPNLPPGPSPQPIMSNHRQKQLQITVRDICKYQHQPKVHLKYNPNKENQVIKVQDKTNFKTGSRQTTPQRSASTVNTTPKINPVKRVFTVRTQNSYNGVQISTNQRQSNTDTSQIPPEPTRREEQKKPPPTPRQDSILQMEWYKSRKNYCDKLKTEMILCWLRRVERIQAVEGKYPCACVCEVGERDYRNPSLPLAI